MKKTFLILSLLASTIVTFGQGNFFFSGPSPFNGVWDNFSSSQPQRAADMNVAFLFGTGTPHVDNQIASSVPTNALSVGFYINTYQAWNFILTDPNFMLATNVNALGMPVIATNAATGGWVYNDNTSFGVLGSANQTYQVFVIGWDKNFATPQAAAAAGSAVGWSAPFSYTAALYPLGTPLTMGASGLTPFGVVAIEPVPEPSALALMGLSAGAFVFFRRRR